MELKVYSEIGKLKKILVHRPGKEVQRIYPEIFERLLFDDIMYLKVAQEEHDYFTDKLKEEGVKVFYIEKLVAEVLDANPSQREKFIDSYLKEADIRSKSIYVAAKKFFLDMKNNLEMVRATIAGVKKSEIKPDFSNNLTDLVLKDDAYPFYADPIPNILFQRDPIATIFDGMNLHKMYSVTRRRESVYYEYGFKLHPEFKNIKYIMDPSDDGTIEGGDVLVMNKENIFVGISQRTTAVGVEILSKKLFKRYDHLKIVVGIEIPKSHATMHLDTILTQMDHDKFSIDADFAHDKYTSFEITRGLNDELNIKKSNDNILTILQKHIHPKTQLIIVGGDEYVRSKREQWNDGANCLCIEPGKIIVYNRNVYTNKAVKAAGIETIEIKSSELSSGRGGPRCMSMPLERENI
ncbi:arginine deiminase [Candidatus Mycoplasma mahonii]|uniref:arginine deiminase n=1 Tax=Candidatus Mycoplasma mahonii TaxID=3004105 RepID=UPI0026EE2CBF|nr:arginine deiminase [Candidatus Mycoplasma mahonii]WKX02574.1 arginine deiminase [Candidatus Mycoplasma mahonii]